METWDACKTGWQKDGSYVPCPECHWAPRVERNPLPGVAVHMPGTTHHGDCPTVPRLTPEDEARLRADLDAIAECHRRAWAESRNYVIG